ncbi:hypothetical protein BDR05DRAFT_958131 [Suillus weaverae]|nr:hypothetical protein BDR05DRAFT_958131 [Suillus weaverae]
MPPRQKKVWITFYTTEHVPRLHSMPIGHRSNAIALAALTKFFADLGKFAVSTMAKVTVLANDDIKNWLHWIMTS